MNTNNFPNAFNGITAVDPVNPGDNGSVRIEITPAGNIQVSTFSKTAFNITNTGDKRIAAILFDITEAQLTDAVFDPLGVAGDSTGVINGGLNTNTTAGTGMVVPPQTDPEVLAPFLGTGGTAGYEGLLVRFDETMSNGFESGESVQFGVDADPNSIIGLSPTPTDINGDDPRFQGWDIGGVSGAELLNAQITVLFSDGTTGVAELAGMGNVSGGVAVIDQSATPVSGLSLTVNGATEGGAATFGGAGGESVIVDGPAGTTLRVVMSIGFNQPYPHTAPDSSTVDIAARLASANDPFGANNLVDIQTVDVVLTGQPQDITSSFDFAPSSIDAALAGATPSISFTANAIDGSGDPISEVLDPIYLQHENPTGPDLTPPTTNVNSLAEMTQLSLQGVSLNNPTTVNVGADGKLYVTQQNGLLAILTINREVIDNNGTLIENWTVTDRADVSLVQEIPNHSDTGVYEANVNIRQVTGAVTTVDENGNVMLYVTSSDPRIGGGGSGEDAELDTNSGIISRLKQVVDQNGQVVTDANGDPVWEKLDLVRGLPRSEENHAVNGLEIAQDANGANILVVTVGGHTNAGAQGNNFAYTSEYYYAASIISVDLDQLATMEANGQVQTYSPAQGVDHDYLYDLPTLDDPTRANNGQGDLAGDGSNTADVFGGNDGLNQAVHDPLGIVKFLAYGFRNQYDVTVTESGAVYTVDNGPNAGWGGAPLNAQGQLITDNNSDGLADNGPAIDIDSNLGLVNSGDELHRIIDNINDPLPAVDQLYYAGHPNYVRASGETAGIYLYAAKQNSFGVAGGTPLTIVNGQLTPTSTDTDLTPFITDSNVLNEILDARQEVFVSPLQRATGIQNSPNGALYTFESSTNGVDEYTASGGLKGSIITVSFDNNIYALKIGANGEVESTEVRALISNPLDVVAQGDDDPYPGVIFVAAYGADQIVILSPDQSAGVTPNPNDRDEDGIDDTIDPFAADPNNGLNFALQPGQNYLWTFELAANVTPPNDSPDFFDGTNGLFNGGDIGFTGLMTNRGTLPEGLYSQPNFIFGGAPGILQVKSVDAGDPSTNTQRNAVQFGVALDPDLDRFVYTSKIDNFLDEIGGLPSDEKMSQGVFIGAGDQDNYVSVELVRQADGKVGFEVNSQFAFDFIGATPVQTTFIEVPELSGAGGQDILDIGFDVDVVNGTVTPIWTYTLGANTTSGSAPSVTLLGDALAALQGTLTLPDSQGQQVGTGLAIGVLASRDTQVAGGVAAAISAGGDESFTATIDGNSVTFVPDTSDPNVNITGASKVAGFSETLDTAGTDLDELYTEERYASSGTDFGYDINTGNGFYVVDLFFSEAWSGAFNNNVRVFGVEVEGVTLDSSLDIYATVGSNAELRLTQTVEVTDGVLDVDFTSLIENAKINAVLVRSVDVFPADWDEISITGFGNLGPDTTGPSVVMTVSNPPAVPDDTLTIELRYSDNRELDLSTIAQGDLTIAVPGDPGKVVEVLSYQLNVSANNSTATATYTVRPLGGWIDSEEVQFSVANGAYADVAGNSGSGAPVQSYSYGVTPDTTAPIASVSIVTVPVDPADPLVVEIAYSDDRELDLGSIDQADLAITGSSAATQVTNYVLTPGAGNTTAVATYTITATGGWVDGDQITATAGAGTFTDTSGNANAADSATFAFGGYNTTVFALNVAGGAYAASDGVLYQADDVAALGKFAATHTAPISGTTDDVLYQSERWSGTPIVYEVPVANGVYLARIHFAENYDKVFNPGGRLLDVSLEGTLIQDDLDVYATVGAEAALVIEQEVVVSDGSFTLQVAGQIQNPMINAFALLAPGGTPPSDTTPPTVTASVVTAPATASDNAVVEVVYTDETGLDLATIQQGDLSIGAGATVANYATNAIGNTLTATYTISPPSGGWVDGQQVDFTVASGAFADAAGNASTTGAAANFTYTDTPPVDTTPPTVSASVVTAPATASDNAVIQVVYTDETGLNLATIQQGDLSVGAGATVANYATSQNGDTLTATYTIAPPSGGWVDGQQVDFTVASGAFADAAGNANTTGAAANFTYTDTPPPAGIFEFKLVNADTDTILDQDLSDGAPVLDAQTLASALAVGAFPVGQISGNVALTLTGPNGVVNRTEGAAPYMIFGDNSATGNYFGQVLPEGQYTLSATNNGVTESVTFTLATTPPVDATPPTVSASVTGAPVQATDNATIEVVYTDETGLDVSTIQQADLSIGGGATVANYTTSQNGNTLTATYTIAPPAGGWVDSQQVDFTVAAGAFADAAGNANTAGATTSLTFSGIPTVTAAVTTAPAAATDSAIVELVYNDETGLNLATIEQGDLSITPPGASVTNYTLTPNGTSATAVYTIAPPSGGWVEGQQVDFSVAAGSFADSQGNANTAGASADFTFSTQPVLVFALNAAGPQYTASDGTVFQADDVVSLGKFAASHSAPIAGTTDDALYQTEHWRPSGPSYEIPVANGDYVVQLHFAENYTKVFNVGGRVFDVQLEGVTVEDDLDVFATVGARTALVVEHQVTVTDGVLNIDASAEIQNPMINAFAIFEDDLLA